MRSTARLGSKGKFRSRMLQNRAEGLGMDNILKLCLSIRLRFGIGSSQDRWFRLGQYIRRFSDEGRSRVGHNFGVNNSSDLRFLP